MEQSRLHHGSEIAHLPEEVQAMILKLNLQPVRFALLSPSLAENEQHPEANSEQGCQGWFRETHRSAILIDGKRAASTVIYYLLVEGGRSHWHAVDADETWTWHAGSPIELTVADASAKKKPHASIRLGPRIAQGEEPHYTVQKGEWQAADAKEGWCLVSCIVAPAFEFDGFKLAEKGWSPGPSQ